jgi:phospholipase C
VRNAAALALLAGLTGCAGAAAHWTPQPPAAASRADASTMPIRHVVIVVQENRSFDNYFSGYPGAVSADSGRTSSGQVVRLATVSFAGVGLSHGFHGAMLDYDRGKLDGFDLIRPERLKPQPQPNKYYAYSRVKRSLIEPYWTMAQRYVLADHMFSTEWGASFTAHLMLVAGTTSVAPNLSVVDLPSAPGNCDAPPGTVTNVIDRSDDYLRGRGPFPCFTFPTIADSLDEKGVSWKYYYEPTYTDSTLWNAFEAIDKVRGGPDWRNVVDSPKQVLYDAGTGALPSVSWVIPDAINSDHPGAGSDTGPSWVAAIVNAIGSGPEWNSTAVIVVWDEWGGWYDSVKPPQLDYRGLGFRVPCLIVSPYAKRGYVEHTQYEFGSVLKTIEQIFRLRSIGTTDARANGMLDAFDFTQPPRAFVPIPAKYSRQFFLDQAPSGLPVDDE